MQVALEKDRDALLLCSRVLLMSLFVVFGWQKLMGFSGTVSYMTTVGAPVPTLSAIVAVVMELVVGVAITVGLFTRPLALILAIYTIGTAFIGHHYWTMQGTDQYANMINFFKNISIVGGLLLLCVTGPGKYSVDRKLKHPTIAHTPA